jgi:hypothetical protein
VGVIFGRHFLYSFAGFMLARGDENVFGLRSSTFCPAGHSAMELGAVTRGYLSACPSTEEVSYREFSVCRSVQSGSQFKVEGGGTLLLLILEVRGLVVRRWSFVGS